MVYPSAERSGRLSEAFENLVLSWPNVRVDYRRGYATYCVGDRPFAVVDGMRLVLTDLTSDAQEALENEWFVDPFRTETGVMETWLTVCITPDELESLLPFVRRSYETAREVSW
ncbi:luciferase family protein [Haloprofundus halobius]|uniref:luciferase family protein n=1 Tax=Haloprofundus halobius TaxID=2876194 RepID=UPI001CCF1437|nr:luciferase family protein [Haloprofundus halobius]